LAILLAFIIKYKSSPNGKEYLFRYNENLPAFMLMAIIVALFMGLTVSAEEIIRDRKILKRESFLNLSWNSYLVSKLAILFLLSGIQTFTFILIGNWILEIQGMTWAFWFALFTTSCFANVLGLNISSAFNSAVTVYILIPLLLIPQMILSGLLFDFDKLNELLSTKGKVPLVADLMTSRWAYEAMAVHQFKNNEYQKTYYDYERGEADADFKSAYLSDELKKRNQFLIDTYDNKGDSIRKTQEINKQILFKELKSEPFREGISQADLKSIFIKDGYTKQIGEQLDTYFDRYKKHYQLKYNEHANLIEKKMAFYAEKGFDIQQEKNEYFNESLSDLVRNISAEERIMEYNGELIQNIDPVFQSPKPKHIADYRTAFFFPEKNLFGITLSTYAFNLLVVWCMTFLFYLTLYFELLRHFVEIFSQFNLFTKK